MSFRVDWKCPKCGARSNDVPTSIPDQFCPFCGTPMEKIYTPPVVIFNGTGWTPKFNGDKEKN
jgi:predicted nucleic acid-binding Zn ribbon protein